MNNARAKIGTMKTPLTYSLLLAPPPPDPQRHRSAAGEGLVSSSQRRATATEDALGHAGGPRLTVGHTNAGLLGTDHRALQAAVDYVGALGGGAVEIGPGDFSCATRFTCAQVNLRGTPGRPSCTRPTASSPRWRRWRLRGGTDHRGQPAGFEVGCGVAVWSRRVNGFHITVARIVGRNGATLALDRPLVGLHGRRGGGNRVPRDQWLRSGWGADRGLIIEGNRATIRPSMAAVAAASTSIAASAPSLSVARCTTTAATVLASSNPTMSS